MVMKCISRPYYGEGTLSLAPEFRWKIKYGGQMKGVFLVTLPRYGNDLLEIYSFEMLKKKYYRLYPPVIVGVAKGYDGAVLLAADIVEKTYLTRGDFDVRSYIRQEREADL